MFTGLFAGLAVSAGAVAIVAIWTLLAGRLPGWLMLVFKKFEAVTGINIPDHWEVKAVDWLKAAVSFANQTFGSRLFWRTVIRIVRDKGVPGLLDRFESWAVTIDPLTIAEEHIPAEFKPFVNEAKQEIAERHVIGSIVANAPAEKQPALIARVAPAVAAVARAEIPPADLERPTTPEALTAELNRNRDFLSAEGRAKIEEMRARHGMSKPS